MNVIMLNVFMPNVVMLSVATPPLRSLGVSWLNRIRRYLDSELLLEVVDVLDPESGLILVPLPPLAAVFLQLVQLTLKFDPRSNVKKLFFSESIDDDENKLECF